MSRVGKDSRRNKEERKDVIGFVLPQSNGHSLTRWWHPDMTEMLLLLSWRHVQHYGTQSSSATPSSFSVSPSSSMLGAGRAKTTSSMSTTMRMPAAPEPESFRTEVGKKLSPLLGRLADLVSLLPSFSWTYFLIVRPLWNT